MSVSELFPLWKPRGAPCAECSPCCCSSLQSRWSLTALSLMQIAAAGPPTVSLLQSAVVMMIRRRRRMLNGNWCHDRRSARLNVQSEGGSRFWAALRSDADEVLWSFWITDIEINKTVKVMKVCSDVSMKLSCWDWSSGNMADFCTTLVEEWQSTSVQSAVSPFVCFFIYLSSGNLVLFTPLHLFHMYWTGVTVQIQGALCGLWEEILMKIEISSLT